MNTLENLYYGNIAPHEHTVSNGTDKGELLETVVRLKTELRATLTEQQKALLEQFEKADTEVSDRPELQAFTIGFRLAARLMIEGMYALHGLYLLLSDRSNRVRKQDDRKAALSL